MWDLPRPGLEPVSPALAGRFSTTAPPGKPERIFIALYPVLHMNVYLTWILDSHPQYPVCTIVITYEITVILCSPTTLAQSLGVHSLLPELSSLVSLISVSFPSNPSSTQASDWFFKNISDHVILLLKNLHCVLFLYPEAFKVDSKLFLYSSHTSLLYETFALVTLNDFPNTPSSFMPPCLECRHLFFISRNASWSQYYTSVKLSPIFPHRLSICIWMELHSTLITLYYNYLCFVFSTRLWALWPFGIPNIEHDLILNSCSVNIC